MEATIGLIAAIVLLVGNLAVMIPQLAQVAKVRRSVDDATVVVKDADQLRRALQRPLEGTWTVSGEFSSFQGSAEPHYSSGYMVFTWDAEHANYSVLYAYAVRAAGDPTEIATVVCRGHASSGSSGKPKRGEPLRLVMGVELRTSRSGHNVTRSFTLVSDETSWTGRVSDLSFPFGTGTTSGTIGIHR